MHSYLDIPYIDTSHIVIEIPDNEDNEEEFPSAPNPQSDPSPLNQPSGTSKGKKKEAYPSPSPLNLEGETL